MAEDDHKPLVVDVSRQNLGLPEAKEKPKKAAVAHGKLKEDTMVEKGVKRFFGGDPKDVMMYMLTDVLVPALKDTFVDMVIGGTKRMVYGMGASDYRPSSPRLVRQDNPSYSQNTNYNAISSNRRVIDSTVRERHDFSKVVFPDRPSAENVLTAMNDYIQQYGVVRVKDFYEFAGITAEYTDQNWGWHDIRGSRVRSIYGGYIVELPPTEHLQ